MAVSGRFRVVLSSAFALLGVVSCLAYADAVRSEAERVRSDALERFGGEVASLVVADRQLEAGDVVSEADVTVRDWLAELAPSGAIVSLDDVVGRVLTLPVAEGAPLTELSFRDETALSEVPAGHVAVSVPVTERLGLSRAVTRGSQLNAYVVMDGGPQLVATGIEVLSELGSQTGSLAGQQLTIAVLPDDVAQILGASASGDLRLVIPAADVVGEPSHETDEQEKGEDAPPEEGPAPEGDDQQ